MGGGDESGAAGAGFASGAGEWPAVAMVSDTVRARSFRSIYRAEFNATAFRHSAEASSMRSEYKSKFPRSA